MTIAVAVKVNDGFVLASDSATTLIQNSGGTAPAQVVKIYNNANKIFNLHKGLPIAAMTWGDGSIGPSSISTLAKDLRVRFSGRDDSHSEWAIDARNYRMSDVADRAREFVEERFAASSPAAHATLKGLGLMIGGYSAGSDMPELFELDLGGTPGSLVPTLAGGSGATWHGQPEAITRLLLGVSNALPQALRNLGVLPSDVPVYNDSIKQQVAVQFVTDAMPIQDAIDFAEFLVHTTIQYVRFALSPDGPTVGGPIEVATITKHEGFRWVSRKHYFSPHLNPPMELT